jgi:hypothetical protein
MFQTHYISGNQAASAIELGMSGSVARNSDHYITEAVAHIVQHIRALLR